MADGLTGPEEAVRQTAVEYTKRIAARWPTTRTWREQVAETGAWVASRTTREYISAIRHAAGDDVDAVGEGVERAMQAQEGQYPPSPSDVGRAVARAARRRREEEVSRQRRARRAQAPEPNRYAWLGYLAMAALRAGWVDRGQPMPCPQEEREMLDMCLETGYRNHHGCGPWRDEEGNRHPADPLHDPELYADVAERARVIWIGMGSPAAPSPAALVGGAA